MSALISLTDRAGWPTNAIPGGSLSLNGSAASMANSQTFLDTWCAQRQRCGTDKRRVCASNANRTCVPADCFSP